jgi:hypothetical protein
MRANMQDLFAMRGWQSSKRLSVRFRTWCALIHVWLFTENQPANISAQCLPNAGSGSWCPKASSPDSGFWYFYSLTAACHEIQQLKELSPSSEAASCAATQHLSSILSYPNFQYVFATAFHWALSWTRLIESISFVLSLQDPSSYYPPSKFGLPSRCFLSVSPP